MILVAVIALSSGCRKIIDKYFPGGKDDTSCSITEMHLREDLFGTVGEYTARFTYNIKGNPDTVLIFSNDRLVHTHYLSYNDNDQLVTYNAFYDSDGINFFFTHTYAYNNAGRIEKDSAEFNSLSDMGDIDQDAIAYTLHYDAKGRIIKEEGIRYERDNEPVQEEVDGSEYEYDTEGNRVFSTATEYDDKLNYLRTNPIWMFLQRNYSENNPVGATGYNSAGLPLGFSPSASTGFFAGVPLDITYACE